jgi:hypothetical protein
MFSSLAKHVTQSSTQYVPEVLTLSVQAAGSSNWSPYVYFDTWNNLLYVSYPFDVLLYFQFDFR